MIIMPTSVVQQWLTDLDDISTGALAEDLQSYWEDVLAHAQTEFGDLEEIREALEQRNGPRDRDILRVLREVDSMNSRLPGIRGILMSLYTNPPDTWLDFIGNRMASIRETLTRRNTRTDREILRRLSEIISSATQELIRELRDVGPGRGQRALRMDVLRDYPMAIREAARASLDPEFFTLIDEVNRLENEDDEADESGDDSEGENSEVHQLTDEDILSSLYDHRRDRGMLRDIWTDTTPEQRDRLKTLLEGRRGIYDDVFLEELRNYNLPAAQRVETRDTPEQEATRVIRELDAVVVDEDDGVEGYLDDESFEILNEVPRNVRELIRTRLQRRGGPRENMIIDSIDSINAEESEDEEAGESGDDSEDESRQSRSAQGHTRLSVSEYAAQRQEQQERVPSGLSPAEYMERERQRHLEGLRQLEEAEEKEPERKSREPTVSSEVSEGLTRSCENTEDLTSGDILDTTAGLTAIITPRSNGVYTAHCFPYEELSQIWASGNIKPFYVRNPVGGNNVTLKVYKHPYTGVFIDIPGRDAALRYNTLLLVKVKDVTEPNGEKHTIYTLKPVHRSDFLNEYKINQNDLESFTPREEDLVPKDLIKEFIKAVRMGKVDVVRSLLSQGISADTKSIQGISVLVNAVSNDYTEIVKLLLEAGADINVENEDGVPVLMLAYNKEIAKLLLEAGADVNLKDPDGITALLHVARDGEEDMIKMFLEHGADPNIQSEEEGNEGVTALMALSMNDENLEAVKLLLEHGADINARSQLGNTALKLALDNGAKKIAKLLREREERK